MQSFATAYRGFTLNAFYKFILRAILGVGFAILATRFFFPGAGVLWIAGLAVFLVGMAYVMESFHKRQKGSQ